MDAKKSTSQKAREGNYRHSTKARPLGMFED